MTKATIGLILSDIDGTVLDDQHQVDRDLPERLRQLGQRQIPFVLASARSPRGMAPIAAALGLVDVPLVSYNGALISQGAETLYEQPLQVAELQQVLKFIGDNFPELAIGFYSQADWYCSQANSWIAHEAAITGEQAHEADLQQLVAAGHPAHKLLIIDEAERIGQLYTALEGLGLKETAFYLSKANYLEITHGTVSKAAALTALAQYYGLELAQTMAIGDNFNDLPMLLQAGLGVAMGNAPAAVQEQADAVTAANTQHGVSLALDRYLLSEA